MTPIPLHPNLPTPTTAFGNPAPIAQYYICPHCKEQSPLVREWVGLTDEEIKAVAKRPSGEIPMTGRMWVFAGVLMEKLKEKNT